jgi:hypothetical protein
MNILIDELPESLEVDGFKYPINFDFKTCLRIIMAFEDCELTPQEKQVVVLECLYKKVPANIPQALIAANDFLNGGADDEEREGSNEPRQYSFSGDANFIYAAFRQNHGVDLHASNMHWWEFLALFMDMGSETTFTGLVNLRERVNNGTATKEEKIAARKMGKIFEVPETDYRPLDERVREYEALERYERLAKAG